MTVATEYLSSVIKRCNEMKLLGEKTFVQVSEAGMHRQPNEASNSLAIIIQHLHGNMLSRWTNFLSEDGEKDWRQRDAEFENKVLPKEVLLQLWDEGWAVVLQSLRLLKEEDLLATVTIRSQPLTAIDAINRQVAHYSYHIGQIVYLGKWLLNEEWKSLSIPKGASVPFHEQMKKQYGGKESDE